MGKKKRGQYLINKGGLPYMERKDLEVGAGKILGNWVQDFIDELTERLAKMEEILVIDRIEGNIAVCENRKTGQIKNITIADLPKSSKEGTVLQWKNGKYEIDTSNELQTRIEKKMKDVWE